MTFGFTGTQRGMTLKQFEAVKRLLYEQSLNVLHHGDCIGADAQAHTIARELCAFICIHPPIDPSKRAFCTPYDQMMEPAPYLTRNKRIVVKGRHGLVAAPGEMQEQLRSGTWSTVRYARRIERHIWLVYPDGSLRVDHP